MADVRPPFLRSLSPKDPSFKMSNNVVRDALEQDKREGLLLAVRARWVALAIIGVFLIYLVQDWAVLFNQAQLLGFALIGWLQLKFGRVGKSRAELIIMFFDLLLLTLVLLVPNPFLDYPWPLAMQYHYGGFVYFYVLLAAAVMAYSWRTIIAMGTWTMLLWLSAMGIILWTPAAYPELSEAARAAFGAHPALLPYLDPNNVVIERRVQEVVVFLIAAAILGLGGWRTNRLLYRQVEAARERANLARYFAPTMVDHLAHQDQPLEAVRAQPVAVMFADIVGFTHIAEAQTPAETITMLREFHERMERAVFENGGTLDKFLGDGLMATFGTPETGPEDTANAIRCAHAMLTAMEDMNKRRSGQAPIPLSIGIHYGDAVLGDIGSERRLEYAVIGDVVNVASRLEQVTRELNADVVVSDALISTLKSQSSDAVAKLTKSYVDNGERELRGRDEPIHIWSLPKG